MRHVLLPRAPTTGPRRMRQATATAGLVAPTGGTLGVRAGLLCTAAGAIDLTVVATAANQHLRLTADTHKQPGRRWLAATWTTSALPVLMPRHACVARCGARRRSGLGGLGRPRVCHPAGGHHAIVRAIQRATSATHADLWICGTTQERCPTYPQDQKQKVSVYLIAWKVAALTPGSSQPRHVIRPLRPLYPVSGSHSHSATR